MKQENILINGNIEKLKNLIKCMEKKLEIIERVETRKKESKEDVEMFDNLNDSSSENYNIILKKNAANMFELVV